MTSSSIPTKHPNCCDDDDPSLSSLLIHDAIRLQKSEKYMMKLINQYPDYITLQDINGNMPLHLAFHYKRSNSIIMKLIELNSNTLIHSNNHGNYPFHIACSRKYDFQLMNQIIESYPECTMHCNNDGNYPLHIACHLSSNQHYTTIIKLIHVYPTAVQCCNYNEKNYPLHIACYCSDCYHYIEKLIDAYPNATSQRNIDGNYPLHIACPRTYDFNHNLLVFKLLDSYPNAMIQQNWYGRTPLHEACCHRNDCNVEILLQYYSNSIVTKPLCRNNELVLLHPDNMINIVDEDGNTPLHLVIDGPINSFCVCIVQLILNYHSNFIHHKNNNGKNPFDIANERMIECQQQQQQQVQDIEIDSMMKSIATIISLLNEFAFKNRCVTYDYLFHQFLQQE